MTAFPSLLSCLLASLHGGPGPISLQPWIHPSSLLLPAPELDAEALAVLLPGAVPFGPCEQTAWFARAAARKQAFGDSLLAIANCVQTGGAPWSCAMAAQPALFEAYGDIEEVFDARLDLCQRLGSGSYAPALDPAQFGAAITNPFLPFVPGRVLVYRKITPEGVERTRVRLLPATTEIAGITCAAVRDTVRIDGALLEDTEDWYAQDLAGNVWYLGEIAQNYEDGRLVDLGGSWTTGVDAALPGIVMRANPQVGDCYRQEFALGTAEDAACVVAIDGTAAVPYGSYCNCVVTEDFTPLEPDARERKYYAQGVGMVLAIDLVSGARTELVNVIDP